MPLTLMFNSAEAYTSAVPMPSECKFKFSVFKLKACIAPTPF